ncbi:hypothetical protein TRVA0_007S00958 [Trichomonascus vanleenenianus]|uniref:uncharacterized protein n=1 Tax=Trichomonascus vanleenenianus TaxID=2268995 RepID=UPI003ECB0730
MVLHFMKFTPLSPSGGWFFIPKNWKFNTVVIGAGTLLVAAVTYELGERTTYKSNTEYDDETIARWNKAARQAREASAIASVTGK